MSLKIKIKQTFPPEAKPAKRRIQRIESEDEDVDPPSYDPDAEEPRSKKARTHSGGGSDDSIDDRFGPPAEEEDVDIDGDIEDTRFLHPNASRSISPTLPSVKLKLHNAAASSSKPRTKEKEAKSAKSSKSLGKKPKRQVVYTDSEEEFDDPDVVVTDDGDFEPEEYGASKRGAKGRGVKLIIGKGKKKSVKKDEKGITFRDERKLPPPSSTIDSSRRGKVDDDKRNKSEEDTRFRADFRAENDGPKSAFIDPLDEPIPKKRKLPPIKKNKPAGASTTGPSTAAVKPPVAATTEKKESLTPAPTSNQVGVRKPAGASTDVNLLDSSVYSELFKGASGSSTPNSGLNRKQKEEERKKELNKMRNEARAKREAEARHSFDLQASPEKIQRYEESLRTRRSMAQFPNILGAAFKEMFDRHRAPRVPATGPRY
ncbi:hypothetical protein C8Q74DRAFT_1363080 [Fomes fomentarius]|nr:hypothetical protein C8Q74DRAFT_1363080 [Fomes fomentarius]